MDVSRLEPRIFLGYQPRQPPLQMRRWRVSLASLCRGGFEQALLQSRRGTGRASGKMLVCARQLISSELTVYEGIQEFIR
jgi:hypothetical protein